MSLTISRKVSVAGGTVLRAANNLADVASLSAAQRNLEIQVLRNGLGPRGGIISTGASFVAQTADNAGLAFGTANLSIGLWLRLSDWTPGAFRYLLEKYSGANRGFLFILGTTGLLTFGIGNGVTNVNYLSTAPVGVTDETWAFLVLTIDRAGNITFYVDGLQLGSPVSCAATAAETLNNTDSLTWFSEGATHTAGTLGEAWIINGLLTAAQVLDIYRAGSIAPSAASFAFYQRPDFGTDNGLQVLDLSGNATRQNILRGASGLTHTVPGREAIVTAVTNTSGNQQLLGAPAIDTARRWRLRSWTIFSTGTPTVSLGNVSAGAQYASGTVLTAANNEITPLVRIPGTANLWCNSNSTATLTHTLIFDLCD